MVNVILLHMQVGPCDPVNSKMCNYNSVKRIVGLKWVVVTDKLRDYALCLKFTAQTDNNPLTYIKLSELGTAKIQ